MTDLGRPRRSDLGSAAPGSLARVILSRGGRVLVSIAIGLMTATALSPLLRGGTQRFTDIVAGEIALGAYYKTGDFLLMTTFLMTAFLAYTVLSIVVRRRAGERIRAPRPITDLALLAVPGIFLARWIWSELRLSPSGIPLTPIVGVGVIVAVAWTRSRIVGRSEVVERLALSIAVAAFGFLALAATLALLATASPRVGFLVGARSDGLWLAWTVAATITMAIGLSASVTRGHLYRIALALQVAIPFLALGPFLGTYQIDGSLTRLHIGGGTRAISWALVSVGLATSIREVGRRIRQAPSVTRAVLPSTVVLLAGIAALSVPALNAFSMADDFHTGEASLQWQQLIGFDQEPFRTFIPIPGMIGLLNGGLNQFLFEGTAASFPLAASLSLGIIAAGTAWLLIRLAGPHWAVVAATTLIIPWHLAQLSEDRLYLLLPTLIVLSLPRLLARPPTWLALWGFLALGNVALMPSTGVALALATMPVGAWVAMAWLRQTRRGRPARLEPAGVALGVALIALVLLLLPSLKGLADYLFDSARSNTVAYGMGLFQFPQAHPASLAGLPDPVEKPLWLLIRFAGWIVVLPAMVGLLHAGWLRGRVVREGGGPTPFGVFALTTGGFLVAAVPYALGRVDPYLLSRPGTISLFAIMVLLPLALILYRKPGESIRVIVAVMVIGASLWGYFLPRRPSSLLRLMSVPIRTDPGAIFVTAEELRLPNVGDGPMQTSYPTTLTVGTPTMLSTLDGVIRQAADDHETYYDATNRNLMYYALGREVPTPYSAAYYAADEETQRKVLSELVRAPPPIVWTGPSLLLPFSLRSYRIHRWLVEEDYRYLREGELEFLVHPDRQERFGREPLPHPGQTSVGPNLAPTRIGAVPAAWARSFPLLASRFEERSELTMTRTSSGRGLVFRLPVVNGEPRPDFLFLEATCSSGTADLAPTVLSWLTPHGASTLTFGMGEGGALIPLGAQPSWLAGDVGPYLYLGIGPDERCGALEVTQGRLLRLEG